VVTAYALVVRHSQLSKLSSHSLTALDLSGMAASFAMRFASSALSGLKTTSSLTFLAEKVLSARCWDSLLFFIKIHQWQKAELSAYYCYFTLQYG